MKRGGQLRDDAHEFFLWDPLQMWPYWSRCHLQGRATPQQVTGGQCKNEHCCALSDSLMSFMLHIMTYFKLPSTRYNFLFLCIESNLGEQDLLLIRVSLSKD